MFRNNYNKKNSVKNRNRNGSADYYEKNRPKRVKRLDMRKTDEFNFMLGKIVEELPDSIRGAIRGSIYSIASKKGTKEAKDFISKKHQEGIIGDKMEQKLIDLVFDYSKFR
ncbi:MAG: hypothetical protein QW597_03120 [Thermoplasmataceae archaeon]